MPLAGLRSDAMEFRRISRSDWERRKTDQDLWKSVGWQIADALDRAYLEPGLTAAQERVRKRQEGRVADLFTGTRTVPDVLARLKTIQKGR